MSPSQLLLMYHRELITPMAGATCMLFVPHHHAHSLSPTYRISLPRRLCLHLNFPHATNKTALLSLTGARVSLRLSSPSHCCSCTTASSLPLWWGPPACCSTSPCLPCPPRPRPGGCLPLTRLPRLRGLCRCACVCVWALVSIFLALSLAPPSLSIYSDLAVPLASGANVLLCGSAS